MSKYLKLFIAIMFCEAAGIIGSVFTINSVTTWYTTLTKPPFNPPPWIFGPVWTLLYFLMGISLYLVWMTKNKKSKINALRFFYIQLALNSLWSILFFGFKNPLIAFIEVLVLWVMILLTLLQFAKINKYASYLLYPYLAWVTFASVLNFSIVILNP